ncbi:MAG: pyruvate kinase [Gammaproteobacteria bacterium]|nr:pyruvate kinase [Gammaproteobacteria bacterium]
MRRTKIVATLGPATDDPKVLERLIAGGLDAARLNYSHGKAQDHAERARAVRRAAGRQQREIALIADLQGPKIRIECFREGPIVLAEGAEFTIDAALGAEAGDDRRVGVAYKALPQDVRAGDTLLLDDGRIVLKVTRVAGTAVKTKVVTGGTLSDHKGLNREGGGLSAPALTRKDRADLRHAVAQGVDYVAVSFPRSAEDIETARKLVKKAGGTAGIIAKIERAEALQCAADIIRAADGIMIARGDLGVEIGDSRLPPVQKQLIATARRLHRFVITATQMMESMIENPVPTRAEVFDVANAVLDGTDAVMLSAETSVGRYPAQAVEHMARICVEAEKEWTEHEPNLMLDAAFERADQAIAMSAIYCANRIGVTAIAALTETGSTTNWMSRINTDIPIFALSRNPQTLRRVTLYRGVYPIAFDVTAVHYSEVTHEVLARLLAHGGAKRGDKVILTKGDLQGTTGGTNGMKIVTVGDIVEHVG